LKLRQIAHAPETGRLRTSWLQRQVSRSETILSSFPNVSGDGYFLEGGVVVDTKSGTSYGTTDQGGAHGWGTIYQIVL
jgi:hypothetical protein